MAWTTPLTAVANASLQASQWNASVRDNLLETAVAKATTAGNLFAATGANAIAERPIVDAIVEATETTTSTSFVNLSGPVISSLNTGANCLVCTTAQMANNTTNVLTISTFEVSGASTVAASDDRAEMIQSGVDADFRFSVMQLLAITTGANTFRMKYRVNAASTASFSRRRIWVMGF
jgi:hypothetical protein